MHWPRGPLLEPIMYDEQEKQFAEMLRNANKEAIKKLIQIMESEATRIGLDLRENLRRHGTE